MTKAEAREKCKTDPIYLAEVLGYDMLETPHRELFNALASPRDKRLILWPRGHFKTSCVVVELVRRILNNPDERIILMQATLKLTKGWLREIRSSFDSTSTKSKLHLLFPEYCTKGKTGTEMTWTCPARKRKMLKEATLTCASPRATQTGQHYTLGAFDDLVNTSNFRSTELLDKLESEWAHYLPLMDPGSDLIVTGTRYSFGDLYARIIAKDKGVNEWEISIRSVYKDGGALLFPEQLTKDGTRKIGFTLELLASLKRDDPEMFAPQYLNQAIATGDQLFSPDLLQRVTKSKADPEYPAQAPCLFTVDLAPTTSSTSDSSVIAVGKTDARGRVWVDEVAGDKWTPFQFGVKLIEMYMRHRPVRILIEKASGAEYLLEFLRVLARDRGVSLPLDYLKAGRQKDAKYLRIAGLESAFKTGRMFLLAGMTDYEKVTEEFSQFPRGRHDDRPDCLALLYSALSANIAFVPTVRKLPYFFDVPYSTESKDTSSSLLGDGFSC